jgi:hypothetical protein
VARDEALIASRGGREQRITLRQKWPKDIKPQNEDVVRISLAFSKAGNH